MVERAIHAELITHLLSSPSVLGLKPPRDAAWPLPYPEPYDLATLYAQCDGLTLASGVVLFGRGELHDVTQWLVLDKGLSWPADVVVVGERRDTVLVLDLDVAGERAGGGLVEVANDDFGVFERVASGLIPYLLVQTGVATDADPPPEITAPRAAAMGDVVALERELARAMYPGTERLVAQLANALGVLLAAAGETERSMAAFERSVVARVALARRGARDAEGRAAWRAGAVACRARGLEHVASLCHARASAEDDAM